MQLNSKKLKQNKRRIQELNSIRADVRDKIATGNYQGRISFLKGRINAFHRKYNAAYKERKKQLHYMNVRFKQTHQSPLNMDIIQARILKNKERLTYLDSDIKLIGKELNHLPRNDVKRKDLWNQLNLFKDERRVLVKKQRGLKKLLRYS